MIYPKKSRLFTRLFSIYNEHTFRKHFYRIMIDDRQLDMETNGLWVANHSSWWDGLLIHLLNQKVLRRDSYAMMSEVGLLKFPFFRKIGAFSVNPNQPKSLLTSLKFTEELLMNNKSVWIFPQGEEAHVEKRPLRFQQGAAHIIKNTHVNVIPVAFYYTFTHAQVPEIFVTFGKPLTFHQDTVDKARLTYQLEGAVTELLDRTKQSVVEENFAPYRVLLNGQLTTSEWLTKLKGEQPNRGGTQ